MVREGEIETQHTVRRPPLLLFSFLQIRVHSESRDYDGSATPLLLINAEN